MITLLLLKFHRWITFIFALPLLAIILTGLVLSFEPAVQLSSVKPQSVNAARLGDLIKRYDPEGKARGISINAAARRITLQGAEPPEIDLETGEKVTEKAALPAFFPWARRTHEHLLGQSWLVIASTLGMVVILCLGILMGLPKLRNSLSGWHKATAWFTLPLIVLSPLTGLCLAFGWTFQAGPASLRSARLVSLPEAVFHCRQIARSGAGDLDPAARQAVDGANFRRRRTPRLCRQWRRSGATAAQLAPADPRRQLVGHDRQFPEYSHLACAARTALDRIAAVDTAPIATAAPAQK